MDSTADHNAHSLCADMASVLPVNPNESLFSPHHVAKSNIIVSEILPLAPCSHVERNFTKTQFYQPSNHLRESRICAAESFIGVCTRSARPMTLQT